MVFTSVEFIVFFCVFYAAFIAIPQSWRLLFVLAASFFFFGYQNPRYLWLLILVILASYGAGLAIAADPARRRLYTGACVALLLGLLGWFKYTDFALSLLDQGLAAAGLPVHLTPLGILLPIGISFFVFQAISYVVDVHRGDKPAEHDQRAAGRVAPQPLPKPWLEKYPIADMIEVRAFS